MSCTPGQVSNIFSDKTGAYIHISNSYRSDDSFASVFIYECCVLGTLTKNEMKLVKFVVGGKLFDILAPGDSNGSTHSQLKQKNADDDIKVVVAYFG